MNSTIERRKVGRPKKTDSSPKPKPAIPKGPDGKAGNETVETLQERKNELLSLIEVSLDEVPKALKKIQNQHKSAEKAGRVPDYRLLKKLEQDYHRVRVDQANYELALSEVSEKLFCLGINPETGEHLD